MKHLFLKYGGWLLFVLAGFTSCNSSPSFVRYRLCLNEGWIFALDSAGEGEKEQWFQTGIPEGKGIPVVVPHTWSNQFTDPHRALRYWCRGWYEKTVEIPKEFMGKSLTLQFDAVYHDAVVWINGRKAGEHKGSGYTRFWIEATPYLKPGVRNKIVVMADNSPSRTSLPFMKWYDWPHDGGIIRGVFLNVNENACLERIKVYGRPETGRKGEGVVHLSLNIRRPADDKRIFSVRAQLAEWKTKKRIWRGELFASLQGDEASTSFPVKDIRWWHFDDPALYVLTVSLLHKGQVVDEDTVRFGFRSIGVTATHFLLNGEPVRLMGIEWMPGSTPGKGMAETYADMRKNLELIKNANCIYIRFHWQQDEFVLQWCDENGLLVQEEIPAWGGGTVLNDTLMSVAKQHLREMTEDHFNHPSLIAWGVGNELDSHDSLNVASLKNLFAYARQLDSTRLVNYVSNRLEMSIHAPENKNMLRDATEMGDVMMFNEYFSTWGGKTTDVVSPELDRIHAEYPGKGLVISEWGLCEPVHPGGDVRRTREMKIQKTIFDSKPYIPGAIYFCLNDYRTHMGEDYTTSYPQRVHGVVDLFLHPKPSYDTLKSLSSPLIVKYIMKEEGKITVSLEGKKGLPSYTVRNYVLSCGEKSVPIPDIQPGEEKTVVIKTDNPKAHLQIRRPTGFVVLEI